MDAVGLQKCGVAVWKCYCILLTGYWRARQTLVVAGPTGRLMMMEVTSRVSLGVWLCVRRAFSLLLPAVPLLILADTPTAAGMPNGHWGDGGDGEQTFVRQGNRLADELGALFMTSTDHCLQRSNFVLT